MLRIHLVLPVHIYDAGYLLIHRQRTGPLRDRQILYALGSFKRLPPYVDRLRWLHSVCDRTLF